MKIFRSEWVQIAVVMLVAAAWKSCFLFWEVTPFNGDEAVVALMGRHILQGARPVFFYGQAYMGSLDAYLVAGGFAVFGEQVWVIRLVQALLYLGTVFTTIWIGKLAFDSLKTGLLAGLILAIPTVNLQLYTTVSLGGYGEALLLSNLTLLVGLVLARRRILPGAERAPWALFGVWGALVGCGLWANGLTLVYSTPVGLYLLWALIKHRRGWLGPFFLAAGLGFVLGSLPWWSYAFTHSLNDLVVELFGKSMQIEQDPWLVRTSKHLVNFLLLGLTVIFGFRAPWAVDWLGLPLLPLMLVFWLAAISRFYRRWMQDRSGQGVYGLLAGIVITLVLAFLLTSFGVDPSGRYFVTLGLPLALVAAEMIREAGQWPAAQQKARWLPGALLALVLVFHLWGNLESASRFPPGFTTQMNAATIIDRSYDQALIDFLISAGETTGYSHYWVTYPLAFQSREQLIFAASLPYHNDLRFNPRDQRYPLYNQLADQSERVAYITTRGLPIDQALKLRFQALGVGWQEKQIGDYRVYYRLTRMVRPAELGFDEVPE